MVVKVKPYIQNEDYNNEIVLHVRLMLTGDMVAFFFATTTETQMGNS